MNLLITGGCGFIGSNLIRHIIDRPEITKLVNLDCLTYAGHPENLAGVDQHPKYLLERVDLRDKAGVLRVVREHGITHVMHLAAESHVDRSITGPGDFIHTNIVGTFHLLEACREQWRGKDHGTTGPRTTHPQSGGASVPASQPGGIQHSTFNIQHSTAGEQGAESSAAGEGNRKSEIVNHKSADPRFLHVSTDEVYGSLGATGLFTETTPYAPNSPYSASKASSDLLVRAYHHTYGLPTVITNCSNNYGPYQFPEKLIPVVIQSCIERRPIPVYGDGMNVRDWLYVTDHAEALWQVLTRGRLGETYNIGGHNEWANINIVRLICDLVDELTPEQGPLDHETTDHGPRTAEQGPVGSSPLSSSPVVSGPASSAPRSSLITFVKDRPGHDRRYAIDAGKIERELGWVPAHTFETGIRETVKWYLANQAWVRSVSGESKK